MTVNSFEFPNSKPIVYLFSATPSANFDAILSQPVRNAQRPTPTIAHPSQLVTSPRDGNNGGSEVGEKQSPTAADPSSTFTSICDEDDHNRYMFCSHLQ